MNRQIQADAAALLSDGRAKVVIGYQCHGERRRPVLVTDPKKVDVLTYDTQCRQNLAVYLKKPDVRKLLPAAVIASPPVLRSLLVLAAESQLPDGSVLALAVDGEQYLGVLELRSAAELLASRHPQAGPDAEVLARARELAAMPAERRAAFWREQFARCTRCYACRAACPACYCQRCIVEKNRPQWISTAAAGHGNYAWSVIRAFHLAGRCTSCGACQAACPQNLPLDLLAAWLNNFAMEEFGHQAGHDPQAAPLIGSWDAQDAEEFIR